MKKYPYSLTVEKFFFCAGPDLLPRLRQATPEETGNYKTVKVAPIKGNGLMLVEYCLRKRWPENKKDREKIPLGRILFLKDGYRIVFHKKSSWRIEIRDANGSVIDRCKRNDPPEAIRGKIKSCIEKFFPQYREYNLSERFVETIIKPYRNIWKDFVDISKAALAPLCSEREKPYLFWEFGDHVFYFGDDLEYYAAKDSGLNWWSKASYRIDMEYFMSQGGGDWLWLHEHMNDKRLNRRPVRRGVDDITEKVMALAGALQIVFKAPLSYGDPDEE